MNFHAQSITQVLDALKTSKAGLKSQEVEKRVKNYGENVLPSGGMAVGRVKVFLSQWKGPLVVILIIAGGVSGFLGEILDMTMIFITIIINVIVGFLQEDKANRALDKLRSMVKHHAVVFRDGRKALIESENIVPGDILVISAGDDVQADARLLQAIDLRVNEAPLTGESLPAKKQIDPVAEHVGLADRTNMVYRGTAVTSGEGLAVVVGTGSKTELGHIAELVKATPEKPTPLQEQLAGLARAITWIIVSIVVVLFALGLTVGRSRYTFLELFQTDVAVAVAAIPEGLVISLTIMLAIGMQQILKRRALVRRMLAAETLGSVSVICTDKTGTLTLGDMRVTRLITADDDLGANDLTMLSAREGARRPDALLALKIGVLANNAALQNPDADVKDWRFIGDTTEAALIRAGMHADLAKHHLDPAMPRLSEVPFTSERKFHATLHAIDHKSVVYVKGAPEVLFQRVRFIEHSGKIRPFSPEDRGRFTLLADTLAAEGLRLLAVAYRQYDHTPREIHENDIQELVFVGLFAIMDPVRFDVKETIGVCKRAGIRVVMVTGDHKRTAAAIGKLIHIVDADAEVLEGPDIARMSEAELQDAVRRVSLYARVDPEHKLRIVEAFRAQGEIVAVTGDGVNDAPALKAADIGVAVGSGTDVAKETADVVLLDDSFSTIVSAIQEGRRLYHNIKKVVLYLLAGSLGEVLLIAGSIVGGLPLAILPVQILWVNIVEDSFPNIALAFDPGEKENMDDPPRRRDEPLLDRQMKILIAIISIVSNTVLFGFFLYFFKTTGDIARTRTLMFVGLALGSLFFIYAVRSMRKHFWQMRSFDNHYLTLAVGGGILLIVAAVYLRPLQILLRTVPLSVSEWAMMVGFALFNVLLIEFAKFFFLNGMKKRSLQSVG